MAAIYFKEKQYLRKTRLMIVVLLITIFVFIIFLLQLFQILLLIDPFLPENTVIVIYRIFEILLVFLLYILISGYLVKMETIISDEGVKFRIFPFMKQARILKKGDIEKIEFIKNRKVKEYSHWSLRRAFGRSKGYFIIYGGSALMIVLSDGKKIVLGTQKKQALGRAVERLLNRKNCIA